MALPQRRPSSPPGGRRRRSSQPGVHVRWSTGCAGAGPDGGGGRPRGPGAPDRCDQPRPGNARAGERRRGDPAVLRRAVPSRLSSARFWSSGSQARAVGTWIGRLQGGCSGQWLAARTWVGHGYGASPSKSSMRVASSHSPHHGALADCLDGAGSSAGESRAASTAYGLLMPRLKLVESNVPTVLNTSASAAVGRAIPLAGDYGCGLGRRRSGSSLLLLRASSGRRFPGTGGGGRRGRRRGCGRRGR